MGRNDKVNMPTSTAGITRYFDDYKSKISFKPGHVIILTLIVIILIVFLHIFGYRMLGVN